MADWTPQSRAEEILFKTINGEPYDGLPQSRIEELLLELKDVIESGGGGGGGTDNYNLLKNLPQINGQTVKGNISGTTLGLVNMVMGKDLSTNDYTNADKAIVDSVTSALSDKVDKVTGKGLSTNDYDNTAKGIVDGVTSALAGKVDKVAGKGLSTNDYTNADKAIVDGVTSALAGKVDTSLVGSSNGVAELDANGRVPSSQLPSYVDDVLEYADLAHFPATGETGKIYIAEDTNKTYRWSGSDYAEISESLALGETSSTAYAGNKGKANADAITAIKDGTNLDSFADVEDAFNYLTFEGTQADWNLLSTAEKKKYKQAIFTDDYDDNPVGNLSALTTTDKSSCVGAINEVESGITNVIAKSMFGGYSKYYCTTQTSIDGIVDNVIIAPQTDDTGYFSAENKANVTGFGNRQFVFGWVNTSKKYAWIIVFSFRSISVGTRENASTFTFKSLTTVN